MDILEDEIQKMAKGYMFIDFEIAKSPNIEWEKRFFIDHFEKCGFAQCIIHDSVHPHYVNICLKIDVQNTFDVFQVIDEEFIRSWEKKSGSSYHCNLPSNFKAGLMMSKKYKILNVILLNDDDQLVLENYDYASTESIEYELFHTLTSYGKKCDTIKNLKWIDGVSSKITNSPFCKPLLSGLFIDNCNQIGTICSDFQKMIEYSIDAKEKNIEKQIRDLKSALHVAEVKLQLCKNNESSCKLQAAIIGQ